MSSAQPAIDQGIALQSRGEYEEASRYFEQAVQQDAGAFWGWAHLGQTLRRSAVPFAQALVQLRALCGIHARIALRATLQALLCTGRQLFPSRMHGIEHALFVSA